MIYLAVPYSSSDPTVCERRFQAACRAAAALVRCGKDVFAPVCHSHPIAAYGLPVNWEFWQRQDRWYLTCCDEVVVLMLAGWQESTGVQAEIEIARELGKPITFLRPAEETPGMDRACEEGVVV